MTLQLTAEQRAEALRRMTPEMREEFDRLLEGVDPRDVDGFGLWLPEVSPTWSWNWRHLLEVRKALMEVTRGETRRLMIFQPPRHGKSEMTTIRYPVWRLEKWPDTRVCVGCYNQRFAERFGRKSRQLAEKRGVVSRNRRAAMEWETAKGGGVYRSCGVGSPPTGEGFSLVILDDVIKSREEAESEAYRERAWEWYQDIYTRLEPNAAIILMMTRWHEDDVAGRLIEEMNTGGDQWKIVVRPAIDDDGKALWPERFPRDVLEQYRRVLGEYAFEALYQQRPTAREGNLFKVDRIIEEKAPDEYTTRVRAWDLAATPGGGDFTVGVLLGRNAAGDRWSILDLVRGRWSADERNAIIRTTAVMDGMDTRVRFAQDPGQAGKEQAQGLVGMLGGYVAGSKNVTGNKVTRADPLAAQVNAGNVSMARGDWNRELRDELRRFPNGKNDDIVDAVSDAFAELAMSAPWEFF
jgi:predicted phage terminase large subunit-like protein